VAVVAAKRLAVGVVVLAALSVVSFLFFAAQPGTTPSGRPVLWEYWTWLKGVGSGRSLHLLSQPVPARLNLQPATMLEALGHTAALLGAAFVLVVALSVAFALAAAMKRGSAFDLFLRGASYLAWAVPAFAVALIVQKVLNGVGGSHGVGPFPLAGWPGSCPAGLGLNYANHGSIQPCPAAGSGLHYALNLLRYIALPATVLAVGFVGLHGRYLRSSLLETLDEPFVTTARAKGVSERRVIVRHAMRASAPTFASAVLADFGAIFGAAMAVDWIFELNGLGTVLVSEFPISSFSPIDIYSVQLVLLLTGAFVIASSLLSELVVSWLDPRVRAAS
jgi:peptide/nickel transport system permease protein